jgi:hypothetical protein
VGFTHGYTMSLLRSYQTERVRSGLQHSARKAPVFGKHQISNRMNGNFFALFVTNR